MSKLIIGVDIDNTIVDSNSYWTEYLLVRPECQPYLSWEMYDQHKELGNQHYDVSKVFAKFITNDAALDFWREENLYVDMKPMDVVQRALLKLHEDGHDIVFVSTLKGNHHKSKVQFIKRYFPFYTAFLGTKEKEFVKLDVMIDDSPDVLNRFTDPNVKLIHFDRQYIDKPRELINRKDVIHTNSWGWVYSELKRIADET